MIHHTRDNLHYQSPYSAMDANAPYLQLTALSGQLPHAVQELLKESMSGNSRRAYNSDLQRFLAWGGRLPSTPAAVAIYLAEHADSHAVSTLQRWLASLSRAHIALGFTDPTKLEPARSTLKGIRRSRGEPIRAATPLLRDDLFKALDLVGSSVRDLRDRALLLVGFAGGFRRSELVGLDISDIQFDLRGIIINIRRSKTDQNGAGRALAVPLGRTRYCPVTALEDWLPFCGESTGPLFRPVTRGGKPANARLSGEAVSKIVKQRVAATGTNPSRFSGHSLRSGFATSAAAAGVSSWKIRQQTGHASDAMLARYIRAAELFEHNAAGTIL